MNDITYVGRHTLIHTVSRHAHESWEFVYCTYGSGAFRFDDHILPYKSGEVVVIPPMLPHSNQSEQGFRNIHMNVLSPVLSLKEPAVIKDDGNHFLLDAFNAAFFHFYSDRKEKTAFLSAYGSLIAQYLAAYQTVRPRSEVVEAIERSILSGYADCDYQLEAFLRALPFSYDYLRKLFQKELGVTPHKYLIDKRLQVAAEALVNSEDGAISVADISLMCGFRDPLYFSKMFKKRYGVSPSSYARDKRAPGQAEPLTADSVKVMLEDV